MRIVVRSPSEPGGRLGFLLSKTSLTLLLAVALTLTVGVRSASADYTFDLSSANTAISGYAGPYGHVDVHLTDSTHATVTLTSLTAGGNIYLFGDGSTMALNVNATTFTATGITGSNAGSGFTNVSGDSTAQYGSQNVDGFGSFNLTINTFDGFDHAVDKLTFSLTNTSGTWSSDTNVLTSNGSPNNAVAAAHVFVTKSPAVQSNGALATGYAGSEGSVSVPAPSTLALAFAGLGACGFVGMRRLSRRPVAVPA